jgi:uncharacterized protein YodC (DUF2158 family)
MKTPWKVGDLVQLKSGGGPSMTVMEIRDESYNEPGKLLCWWYESGEKQERLFHADTLGPAAPDESKPTGA